MKRRIGKKERNVISEEEIKTKKVKRNRVIANIITTIIAVMFSYFTFVMCMFQIFPSINAAGYGAFSQSENAADLLIIYYPGFICLDGLITYYAVKLCKVVAKLTKTLSLHVLNKGLALDEDSEENERKFILK